MKGALSLSVSEVVLELVVDRLSQLPGPIAMEDPVQRDASCFGGSMAMLRIPLFVVFSGSALTCIYHASRPAVCRKICNGVSPFIAYLTGSVCCGI